MSNSHLDGMSKYIHLSIMQLKKGANHNKTQSLSSVSDSCWAEPVAGAPSTQQPPSFHVNRLHEGACLHARRITLCYRWQVHRIAPDVLIMQLHAAALMRVNALHLRERGHFLSKKMDPHNVSGRGQQSAPSNLIHVHAWGCSSDVSQVWERLRSLLQAWCFWWHQMRQQLKNTALAALTISIIPGNWLNPHDCSLPEFDSHIWILPNPTYGVNQQLIFTLDDFKWCNLKTEPDNPPPPFALKDLLLKPLRLFASVILTHRKAPLEAFLAIPTCEERLNWVGLISKPSHNGTGSATREKQPMREKI